MAKQVKVLAAKHDSLASVPRTNVVERTDSYKVPSDLHPHTMSY